MLLFGLGLPMTQAGDTRPPFNIHDADWRTDFSRHTVSLEEITSGGRVSPEVGHRQPLYESHAAVLWRLLPSLRSSYKQESLVDTTGKMRYNLLSAGHLLRQYGTEAQRYLAAAPERRRALRGRRTS